MNAPARLHGAGAGTRERGIALVTTLLLLVIITILALSMFRSFGTQEKIAGNIREKDRALHAAETAQQFAEWWLLQGTNIAVGATTCTPPALSVNTNPGQICNQTLQTALGLAAGRRSSARRCRGSWASPTRLPT